MRIKLLVSYGDML